MLVLGSRLRENTKAGIAIVVVCGIMRVQLVHHWNLVIKVLVAFSPLP